MSEITPVICIVGRSKAGKTTLIEGILAILKEKYKVGTIKHDVHSFEMDYEGKDTYRHKKSGALAVAIISPQKFALIRDTESELSLDEVLEDYFKGFDLVIAEGFKSLDKPKIEVIRSEISPEPITRPEDGLIALACNKRLPIDLPQFSLTDYPAIARFIEERFIDQKAAFARSVFRRMTLKVNGKVIPLKPFVKNILSRGIFGMVSTLKDCEEPKKIEIIIKEKSTEEN